MSIILSAMWNDHTMDQTNQKEKKINRPTKMAKIFQTNNNHTYTYGLL